MKKIALLIIILLNNFSFAQSDIFKSNVVVYETGVLDDDNNITYFNNYIASSLEEIEKNQIIIKKYKNNYFLIIDQNLWSGEIGEIKNTRINDFSLKTSFLWAIKSEDDYISATVILRQEKNEKLKIIDTYMLVIFDNKNIFEFKGTLYQKLCKYKILLGLKSSRIFFIHLIFTYLWKQKTYFRMIFSNSLKLAMNSKTFSKTYKSEGLKKC